MFLVVAQALDDVASLAIIHDQIDQQSRILVDQLQHALDSRVAIEQGKGIIAERAQIKMDEAFRRLRTYARSHNNRLTDVAFALAEGARWLDEPANQPSRSDSSEPR